VTSTAVKRESPSRAPDRAATEPKREREEAEEESSEDDSGETQPELSQQAKLLLPRVEKKQVSATRLPETEPSLKQRPLIRAGTSEDCDVSSAYDGNTASEDEQPEYKEKVKRRKRRLRSFVRDGMLGTTSLSALEAEAVTTKVQRYYEQVLKRFLDFCDRKKNYS